MVLLETPQPLDLQAVLSAWSATWPAYAPPAPETNWDDGSAGAMTMTIGSLSAAIAVMPVPIPEGELDGPAATSWLWPGASTEVARVGAHVVVWVSGDAKPADVHRHQTRLVCAVIRATNALGVYAGAAGMVIRADAFEGLAHAGDGDLLPVELWIDFRGFVRGETTGLFTVGLAKFGLMEIEIPTSSRPIGELRDVAMNVARYLIANGPTIADGQTVGSTDAERISVRHTPSMIDRSGTVYSLYGP